MGPILGAMATDTSAPTGRPSTRTAPPEPGGLTGVALFVLLIGLFLPLTDFFIVNVALPTIDRDLHASAGMLQLVVAGYAISYATLLVVGGRLGDAVGRRRLFTLGMVAFTLTSLACGLAPSAPLLVAARVLQGAASAVMLPQVLTTIQATTSGAERNRALGFYGATGGIATVVGQLLGGVLVAANLAGTGWRPIFLVNVPVGIVGILIARRAIPETRSSAPAQVDAPGTVLLGASLLALLVPLTEGRALGWPAWTIVLLVSSPFLAAAFVRAERQVERAGGLPLVPLSILEIRSMRRGLILGVPFFAGFAAFMFVYALTLQDGAGFSALTTGLTLIPMAVAYLGASLSMPRLVARWGRSVLTVGAGVQLVGLVGLAFALASGWPHPSAWVVGAATLPVGVGQGLVLTPLFRLVVSEVPSELAGVGSGVLTTTQQTSLGLGVATIGSLYLTELPASHLGGLHAVLLVLSILMAISVLVGVATRALPADAGPATARARPTRRMELDAAPTIAAASPRPATASPVPARPASAGSPHPAWADDPVPCAAAERA